MPSPPTNRRTGGTGSAATGADITWADVQAGGVVARQQAAAPAAWLLPACQAPGLLAGRHAGQA